MSSTGQAAGYVVGAVAGFMIPGVGLMLGAQIGGMIGGYLDPPKGPKQETPATKDLTLQTSTYGALRPRLYGTIAVYGNIFWLENNKYKVRVKKTKQGGGKGGAKKTTIKTKVYYATFAYGLCDCTSAPIAGVGRIWIGGKLWYDAGSTDVDAVRASNEASTLFTVHTGSESQLADDRMQATLGIANCPAYRGLAYIVFKDFPLAAYSDTLVGLQIKVEVFSYATLEPSSIERVLPSSGYWVKVEQTEVMAMAIDTNSNTVGAVTYDGMNWSPVTIPTSGSVNQAIVAKDAKTFLVLESNTIAKLTQNGGVTWSSATISGSSYSFSHGIWTGEKFIICPANGSKFFSSPDAVVWTQINLPISRQWSRIIYNGSVYLAIHNDSGNDCITSLDGVTWTTQTMASTTRRYAVAWNGSVFCVPSEFGAHFETSPDGAAWTYHSPAVYSGGREIVWNGTYFITPNNGGTTAAYSADGITWTLITTSATSVTVWAALNMNGVVVMLCRNSSKAFTLTLYNQGASETLSTIVSSEVLQSKLLSAGDIDVTLLAAQLVRGYKVSNVAAIRSGLEPLQAAWPFDVVHRGYQLKFKPRGTASIATIPEADLDARSAGESAGVSLTSVREMDSVLPRRVTMQYLDYSREYDVNTQYAERLNTDSVNIQSLDLAIVLTSDEAAQIVEVLLYLYWMERYSLKFTIPAATYNNLEPGDVVTVTTSKGTYALRLTQVTYTPNGLIECDAKYSRAATYVSTAVGGTPEAVTITLAQPGYSLMELMDVPLLDDTMNQAGYISAMTGYSSGWPGGIVFRSDDGGASWLELQAFTDPGSSIGYASNAIGAGRTDIFDNSSVLQVYFAQGTFAPVTELAVLNGDNYFAYGVHGRWEIIAAKTCVLQGDGSYKLSDLLRGRKGTEWACGLHQNGDTVVALDNTSVIFVGDNTSSIGVSRIYRGVTDGQLIESVSDYQFTYTGVNLECYAPVYLSGSRHPTTNDWTLTWIPRTRVGGEWRDYVDATMVEASESYDVEFYSSPGFTTIKRTITASTPTVTYTSAQQLTDFGNPQQSLNLRVKQNSSVVGQGYPLQGSLNQNVRSVLLMHMDTTGLTDEYGKTTTLYGGVTRSSAQSRFGGYSALFDGTSKYISLATSSDFNFGTGDCTVECWIYPTNGVLPYQAIFASAQATWAAGAMALTYYAATKSVGFHGFGLSPSPFIITPTNSVPYNTLQHVALVVANGQMTIYVQGVPLASKASSVSVDFSASGTLIGRNIWDGANGYFGGHIDELRVKRFAQYGADFSASLPSSAFTE